jgi:predicted metal-binding membrane protein
MAWPGLKDRRVPAIMLAALAALAWSALWAGRNSPWGHTLHHSAHAASMGMNRAALAGFFVLGWTLMTIAMMLPTSAPLILLFYRLVSRRSQAPVLVALLVTGYLAVWAWFGLAVYLMMQAARAVATVLPWAGHDRWASSVAILLCAGLFQFSSLKYTCLDKCRSPMLFLSERWRGGRPALEAVRLGLSHGVYCLGCCWSLMLLMFVTGMGSVAGMLALGVAMGAEKNFSWGRRLSPMLGVLLIAAALATAGLALARQLP